MKNIKFFFFGVILFFAYTLQAQVSVNVNIGSPPQWGPVGYTNVNYYYLPDVEAYYDVPSSKFIYYEGGAWIHRTNLPVRYRNYDLYGGYKVVMNDYRGKRPYDHYKQHKIKYKKGYRGPAQKNIGNRPEKGNSKGNHYEGNSYKGGNHKQNANHGQKQQNHNGKGGGKGKH